MTFNEYQRLARRTQNENLNQEQREDHALHGMAAELGEIHSIYQKELTQEIVPLKNLELFIKKKKGYYNERSSKPPRTL